MTTIAQLLEKWEARSRDALPSDAMLINRHIRELREAVAQQAQEPVGVVDEGDDGLFVDLETKNGVMVKRGDLVYTHPAPKQAEPAPITPEPAGDVIAASPGRRCTYDNRVTMARECWEDGRLVFCVSSELLREATINHPTLNRLWDFLPIIQHGWHDGLIQGDSMAGPRPPG